MAVEEDDQDGEMRETEEEGSVEMEICHSVSYL